MDDMSEFEKFLKDWDPTLDNASTSYKPVYHKPKKQSNFIPRGDGHGMIDDLDKYMTSEPGQGDRQDIVYDGLHNVWSYLKGEGYSRADIEYINVTYNNILNYIDTLEVKLITGDVLFFENIQLV